MAHRGYWFEAESPRKVRGGIKAQSRAGSFARSWWAKKWIDVLESFDLDSRLARGKHYARRGQVISIDIQKGKVAALVQGSRSHPYKVSLGVKLITPAAWRRAVTAMASEAGFSARLLNGEMPRDIEKAFDSVKLSLFPAGLKELDTHCTCPDWSNPCKHIAAVYYLLGEEFDRDPFLLFRLRGMEREELLEALEKSAGAEGSRRRTPRGTSGAAVADAGGLAGGSPAAGSAAPSAGAPAPLPSDPDAFWGTAEEFAFSGAGEAPFSPPLLARLGSFPFWRGRESFLESMEAVYRGASPVGMDVFLGQRAGAAWDPAAERKPRRLLRMQTQL
ncbi:MAG: SWIM zinc finger family protein [Spirochaetia bacterium]|jgi:uncharacterized Zn finger protein